MYFGKIAVHHPSLPCGRTTTLVRVASPPAASGRADRDRRGTATRQLWSQPTRRSAAFAPHRPRPRRSRPVRRLRVCGARRRGAITALAAALPAPEADGECARTDGGTLGRVAPAERSPRSSEKHGVVCHRPVVHLTADHLLQHGRVEEGGRGHAYGQANGRRVRTPRARTASRSMRATPTAIPPTALRGRSRRWRRSPARRWSAGWRPARRRVTSCCGSAPIPRRRWSAGPGRATPTMKASTCTPTRRCPPATGAGSSGSAAMCSGHRWRRTRWIWCRRGGGCCGCAGRRPPAAPHAMRRATVVSTAPAPPIHPRAASLARTQEQAADPQQERRQQGQADLATVGGRRDDAGGVRRSDCRRQLLALHLHRGRSHDPRRRARARRRQALGARREQGVISHEHDPPRGEFFSRHDPGGGAKFSRHDPFEAELRSFYRSLRA